MSAVPATSSSVSAQPPVADRRPVPRTHHGDTFADPYEWLRDKDDPDVIAYLEAENRYTEARTGHLADLTEAVFGEIKARTQETDLSVPSYVTHSGGSAYWYYSRTVAGSEYAIHCRVPAQDRDSRPDLEADAAIPGEEVLLDGNVEAEGHAFFSLGAFSVSPSGRLLAYSVDTSGGERFTVRVRDLTTGRQLADEIEDTAYGVAWAGDEHLFYTRADDAWRPYVVLRHRLGDLRARRAVLGRRRHQPGRALGGDPPRQQADLGVPPAAHGRPRGHAARRRPAPRGRGVRRRAGR
jgi:oligopeptidase B